MGVFVVVSVCVLNIAHNVFDEGFIHQCWTDGILLPSLIMNLQKVRCQLPVLSIPSR